MFTEAVVQLLLHLNREEWSGYQPVRHVTVAELQ
jgi:hypothetical protein